jgi:hypothetical protein
MKMVSSMVRRTATGSAGIESTASMNRTTVLPGRGPIGAVGIFFRSFPSTFFTPGRKSATSVTRTLLNGALSATSATLSNRRSTVITALARESFRWCSISWGVRSGLRPVETQPAFCTAMMAMKWAGRFGR